MTNPLKSGINGISADDFLESLTTDSSEEVETPEFTLHPGGKLIWTNWVYDDVTNTGKYVDINVTESGLWLHKRDKNLTLAPGVTLNDIFLFVSKEVDLWNIILTNCYVKDFITAWQKIDQKTIKFDHPYDPEGIEYLNLYWGTDLFTYAGKTKISGLTFPDFDGVGFVLQEDKYEDVDAEIKYKLYEAGQRIKWGIDFTLLEDLLGLPVKLNTEFKVYEEWTREMGKNHPPLLLDVHRDMTLQEVLTGIFWELSFYGTPDNKKEKKSEIMSIMDEIDKIDENGSYYEP